MGYGHQRTADNLKGLAFNGIINSNSYDDIPRNDRNIWERSRKFYEAISNLKRIPLFGEFSFFVFDQFQKIFNFYPKRDLSAASFSLNQIYSLLKKGWGRHLVAKIGVQPLPLLATFFPPALMAEFFDYPGEIFCVVCDADISRNWAARNARKSRIKYFAPTERVAERLKLYGVPSKNIFYTGYPLPSRNIGDNGEIVKKDLALRILNLDPKGRYRQRYKILIEKFLGVLPEKTDHPLTILFSVGGAGAQKEIGMKIIKNLSSEIKKGKTKVVLSAGIKENIKDYFVEKIGTLGMKDFVGRGIEIIYSPEIGDYFKRFNDCLRKTDILWTKPSELSFYSALGIPIIVSPPIGSQEEFNRRWLLKSGFGLSQESPDYIRHWLFDWLDCGYLAEAAMEGLVEGKRMAVRDIEKIIFKKE